MTPAPSRTPVEAPSCRFRLGSVRVGAGRGTNLDRPLSPVSCYLLGVQP